MNQGAVGLRAEELETPALCLDIEIYERNLARMRDYMARYGLQWRPHMKGQKAPELAVLAVQHGAIGVTCATVYEAEAMVRAGVKSVLLAHEAVGERKLARLVRLPGVMAATDSVEHARMVDAAARAAGVVAPVIVELNVGMNRCGIAPGDAALALVREIHALDGLRFAGLMGWEGHVLGVDGADRAAAVHAAMTALVETAELCRRAGYPVEIVSAGGSGTFLQTAPFPGLTEMQAGGGVFSDLSYQHWGLTEHEFALTVMTRVVSRPTATRAIVDAGFKTLSEKLHAPRALVEGVKKVALSAEHGTLELDPASDLAVGSIVRFVPGYTDSTVCLHDEMCVVRGGVVEAVWTIPGRGGLRS